MDLKATIPLIAVVGGALVTVIGWASQGYPPLATQAYVGQMMWPVICRQYKNQVRIDQIDLFQWQSSNPKPYGMAVQSQIDGLNADIAFLNNQIAQNCS